MIERFHVRNFKALKDVTLDLTPIHVLIGANDTGKTSILEAIAALCRSERYNLTQAFLGPWNGTSLVWGQDSGVQVSFVVRGTSESIEYSYSLATRFDHSGRTAQNALEQVFTSAQSTPTFDVTLRNRDHSAIRTNNPDRDDPIGKALNFVRAQIAGVQYCRWDPRQLALPVAPSASRRFRIEQSGFGLALCLDDILGYERKRFDKLEERFRSLFPQVESIQLVRQAAYDAPVDDPEMVPKLQPGAGKGIQLRFKSGDEIPASQVSDGMLIVLAYLAVLYLPVPPRVLLVEEPENGVHPARLKEIVSILREIVAGQSHTQIIIATHSPYLVDSFSPDEVTLCKKENDGSVSVHRLSESKTVHEQMDVFTLGEIWTAEGDEALTQKVMPEKDTVS